MDGTERKFIELQKFIPFLEKFLSIKPPNTNDAIATKYAKTEKLLDLLKSGFKR